jgi:predicted DNA-binding protein YlxM (UPF0122 family)
VKRADASFIAENTPVKNYVREHRRWVESASPTQLKKICKARVARPLIDGYSSAVPVGRELKSSCGFNYDQISRDLDHEANPSERIGMREFLVRGLILVREDIRPHLVIDCIFLATKHPHYQRYNQSRVAEWNNVSRMAVSQRVAQVSDELEVDTFLDEELVEVSQGLVGWLVYISRAKTCPKFLIDCISTSVQHASFAGVSLESVAVKFGVSKQAVHKKTDQIRTALHLPPSRANKSPSLNYAIFNTNCKKIAATAAS